MIRTAATLAIGTVGGYVFYLLSMPLPWMLGSMTFCLLAVFARVPIISARKFRPPLIAVIGVTLGSAFSFEIVMKVTEWYPILAAILFSSAIGSAVAVFYLVRVARFDLVTAYFAGMPGGLFEMVHQGGAAGGDERSIALIQASRIFFVVLFVPLFFRLSYDLDTPTAVQSAVAGYSLQDAVILIGCAVVGWPLARLLRFPNPPLIGPLLLSALVHILDQTRSTPPYVLVSAAQVVLGSSVGGQFIGTPLAFLARMLSHGVVLVVLILTTCVGFAFLLAHLTGYSPALIVLALAPGGMAEMCLIALALQADVAFVIVHQLFRVVLVHLVAPNVFRLTRHIAHKKT